MEVIFLPSARRDIRDSYGWYEKRQFGLGNRFIREVIEFSQKLKRENIEYRKYFEEIQCIKLTRFPFTLYFLKGSETQIFVMAVLFNRKDILNILRERK